jgi:hypothetical protein
MNTSESSKSFLRFFAFAILFIFAIANTTPAQQLPPEASAAATQKEKEQRQELEKKTLALLNDIASDAWTLKLPENRIFVMTSAADLLWKFDEKRARSLYWDAINSLNLLTPPARRSSENLSKDEKFKIRQSYWSVFGLRRSLLRQVAKRDAQLALEMLRATRQAPPRELKPGNYFPDDRQLEQDIATAVAARDPAHALQLARESLGKGITLELLNLIQQLNEKDSGKASEFAGEVISKLRLSNVASDFRSSTVAVQLLQYSRMPDRDDSLARLAAVSKILRLSDDQKRELVEIVTNAALSTSANSNLLFDVPQVMPEIRQFFPERLDALEQKWAAFNQTLNKQEQNLNALNDLIRRGNSEEIVRRAAGESERERLPLYQQAAIIAVARGTTDSFRDLVSKEIKDEDDQHKILDLVDAEQISTAAGRKQIDELKKLLPKIRRNEERARAMIETALLLKEKGEDAEAATLLDEAAELIKPDLKSETQTNALLTLLSAYALIDPPKAFALAERTIDRANSQISLLLLVDRVVSSGAVKKSEIILDQAGIMPLDFLIFKYGKGVAVLAAADFNRTKALADRFDRYELRILARLLVAKGILTPASPAQTY